MKSSLDHSVDANSLILASSSPRRRQLMEAAGFSFVVIEPDESAETSAIGNESAPQLVVRLAEAKAANVAAKMDRGRIVAADTVAECDGQILGKPDDREHARAILSALSGRQHRVFTGVCLWDVTSGRHTVQFAETRLEMNDLSAEQIDSYLQTGLWQGKAGAFGYQDGNDWVRVIEGSESNVVGLPLDLLAEMLRDFGWNN